MLRREPPWKPWSWWQALQEAIRIIANNRYRRAVRNEIIDVVGVLRSHVELGQVAGAINADRVGGGGVEGARRTGFERIFVIAVGNLAPNSTGIAPACWAETPVIGLVWFRVV